MMPSMCHGTWLTMHSLCKHTCRDLIVTPHLCPTAAAQPCRGQSVQPKCSLTLPHFPPQPLNQIFCLHHNSITAEFHVTRKRAPNFLPESELFDPDLQGVCGNPSKATRLLPAFGNSTCSLFSAHTLTWEWTTQFYHTAQHTASSETSAKELHGAPIQKKLLYHHRLVNAIGVGNRKPKDSAEIAFCVTRCQIAANCQTKSTLKVLTVSYSKCQNQSPFFKCSLLPCSMESRVWSAIQTHSVCLSDIISPEKHIRTW